MGPNLAVMCLVPPGKSLKGDLTRGVSMRTVRSEPCLMVLKYCSRGTTAGSMEFLGVRQGFDRIFWRLRWTLLGVVADVRVPFSNTLPQKEFGEKVTRKKGQNRQQK